MHRTDKYSQHSLIIWPVLLNAFKNTAFTELLEKRELRVNRPALRVLFEYNCSADQNS